MKKVILHKEKERNSSIELLRIICMFLIVAHHYSNHGGYPEFTYEILSPNIFYIQVLGMFGRMACSVFAMISGFFLVESACKKHYRRVVPIILEMFFYSIGIWAVMRTFNLIPISLTQSIKQFVPVLWGNWYILYYCIFYMFIPFVNKWILSMDRQMYKRLLAIIAVVWCIIPTFTANQWSFGNIIFFFVMYLVGAYIKLYVYEKQTYKNIYNLFVAIISFVLMIASVLVFDLLGYVSKQNVFVEKATYFKEYNTLLAVVCAVSLFLYFVHIKFSNKWINIIAGTTMGIYLIHDNDLFREFVWKTIWPNNEYMGNPVLHSIIKIVGVFVFCFVIDWIRSKTIGRVVEKFFYKHCDNVVEWLKKRVN